MKILLLDNYDSFTYNLLHAVKELGATDIEVVRNDQPGLDNVERFDKSSCLPGRVSRKKQVYCCLLSKVCSHEKYFRCLVWDIRLSARLSVHDWRI